jgi:hypothetical protein
MKKNHSIRQKISNFSLKNWNETLNKQSKEFSEWNQDESHATQLIKTMNSILKFITNEYFIEKAASIRNIWKKIIFKTRSQSRRKLTRNSSQKCWNDSSNIKFRCILHRCCIRFKDKDLDCIMCFVLWRSYVIQNVKFRNRNEYKWCKIICSRKDNKMIEKFCEISITYEFLQTVKMQCNA